jgi:PEP-CTERM motif-containing protein
MLDNLVSKICVSRIRLAEKLTWRITLVLAPLVVLLLPTQVRADGITFTLNFESFSDSTPLTTQYSSLGITFSEATVITAGVSLNELDFPPHSGANVAFDDGGPIILAFSQSASFVGAYFTHLEPLTISAFDAGGGLLSTATSTFSANDVSSGNPPNEFLSVNAPGIADVTIAGAPAGGSFTMDDLTFAVPEPTTLLLLGAGISTLAMFRPHKKRKV